MVGPTATPGRLALAGALVLALAATGLLALSPERVLVVEQAETGEEIIVQPAESGTTVGLTYTHSVEKSRVYDGYAVREDRLENTRMEFESYGWGFPSGANVTRENGTFVYDPPGSLAELYVSPGEIAGHRLHVGDQTYDLVSRSGGQTVRITLDRRSPLEGLA